MWRVGLRPASRAVARPRLWWWGDTKILASAFSLRASDQRAAHQQAQQERKHGLDKRVDVLLHLDEGRVQNLSARPRSLPHGWRPHNRNDKRCVREILKRALDSGEGEKRCEDYARVLRTVLNWSSLDGGEGMRALDLFRGKIAESRSPLNPGFVAFVLSHVSEREKAWLADNALVLARYLFETRGLGDVVDQTDWMKREISEDALLTLCRGYSGLLLSSTLRPAEALEAVADLAYASQRENIPIDLSPLDGTIDRWHRENGRHRDPEVLARLIFASERLGSESAPGGLQAEALVADFLSAVREGAARRIHGAHVAIVLRALADMSLPYTYDDVEDLVHCLDWWSVPAKYLLPTLRSLHQVHWKLSHQVVEDVFAVFSAKVRSLGPGTARVTEMIAMAAEMGFSPPKASLQRCLAHILSYDNRYRCTSKELVRIINALSAMESTRVDEEYIDRIVTYFSKKLRSAENQDLATFLRSLARLNFKPSASTLLLLARIDNHLEKHLKTFNLL